MSCSRLAFVCVLAVVVLPGAVTGVAAASDLSRFVRTLDPAGNPTKIQTTRGTTDSNDAYEYDTRNRLTFE